MKTRTYVNGVSEQLSDMTKAREILQKEGIYNSLGNFAPYFPNKLSLHQTIIKKFEIEEFEFIMVEYECMSLSLGGHVSAPHKEKAIWFQRLSNN
jgi:hypothetical protein